MLPYSIRCFTTSPVKHSYVNPNKKSLIVDKFKTVTILSINQTKKNNVMNESLLTELAENFIKFEEDVTSSVAVLNGIGGNFSVGYDIDEIKDRSMRDDLNAVKKSLFFPFHRKTAKPILCSISGLCKSVGFEIALNCDLRYVEEKTFLGFQNRQFGIPLLNNGPQRLADLIGLSKAIEFLLLDRLIGAREAVELGIANSVVQDGTALGTAIKTAVFLSSLPQSALRHDLKTLCGFNMNELDGTENWQNSLSDIKSSINLDEKSLKSLRISKLNDMQQWELDEIRHEIDKNNKI